MKTRKQTVGQWANGYARGNGRGKATDYKVVLGGYGVKVTKNLETGYQQKSVYELEIPFSLVAHCKDALDYLDTAVRRETGWGICLEWTPRTDDE